MRVVIYESSSFGGCYEYSRYLLEAYKRNGCQVSLLLPHNSVREIPEIRGILINDRPSLGTPALRKLHFLLRNLLNPFILFFYLLVRKPSAVLLNDFEQISAPLWAPLFRFFLGRHRFLVFLHDPDRDNYPPSKAFSVFCMKQMMKVFEAALYHEYLPEKPYYDREKVRFIKVPHGIYRSVPPDVPFLDRISGWKEGSPLLAVIGNIRQEKNYRYVISALKDIPGIKLLIAGAPASSSVSPDELKGHVRDLGLDDRVLFVTRFLSDQELSSCIEASDIIVLYYAASFTSQSGILNLIAPFRKKTIISEGESSLSVSARNFGLGFPARPDDQESFNKAVRTALESSDSGDLWDKYLEYASWDNHAKIVLNYLYSYEKS